MGSKPPVPYLVASLVSLCFGPALGSALERAPKVKAAIEWAVTGGLLALILAHVIPEAIELAHFWVFPVVAASVLATLGLEKWAGLAKSSSAVVFGLGMLALGVHSALDGAALGGSHGPGAGHGLAIAVVLHRIPTSMAIWWLVKRTLGTPWAAAVMVWDGASTVLGYFAGEAMIGAASPMVVGLVQAVIAGALLHVAFHVRGHGHGSHRAAARSTGA
jgi:hypothetical protein